MHYIPYYTAAASATHSHPRSSSRKRSSSSSDSTTPSLVTFISGSSRRSFMKRTRSKKCMRSRFVRVTNSGIYILRWTINHQFVMQGATTSSSFILRKKYDALYNGGNDYLQPGMSEPSEPDIFVTNKCALRKVACLNKIRKMK